MMTRDDSHFSRGSIIQKDENDVLRSKYHFTESDFEILIKGKSIIDSDVGLSSTYMKTLEEVDTFVRSYGYDLDNPIESAEVFGNFQEALSFIKKYFLAPENPEGLRLEIPKKILEISDIRELFLMSTMHYPGQQEDTQGVFLKKWSCCILKMIHTIGHIDKDVRSAYFTDIQKQVFDRFYKLLQRDENGVLFLGEYPGDPMRVNLVRFETKPKKSRESIVLKLLHKAESVAEDIFDRVGIRFVTETRFDAIRVLKFLKDTRLIVAANVKPSRSRNTLIDLDRFFDVIGTKVNSLASNEISEKEFCEFIEKIPPPAKTPSENKHTSDTYRAIQFTSRFLIKLKNPIYDSLKDLKNLAKSNEVSEDFSKILENIDMKYLQRELRFFYPFEIQIVDAVSNEENEKGTSSHIEYKKAQIQTALKRIMGPFLDAT